MTEAAKVHQCTHEIQIMALQESASKAKETLAILPQINESLKQLQRTQEKFLEELTKIVVNDREHQVRVEQILEDMRNHSNKFRRYDEEILPKLFNSIQDIEVWRGEVRGERRLYKAIPVVCTLITTFIAIAVAAGWL